MNQSDFVDDPVEHGASGLCKLHRWTSLSASELPIPEDAWIRSVVSIDAGERWSQWLALPRYRVCRDFSQWAVVVVAFAESHDGGALMSLFSGNLIPFRAAAFAVSRSDGQLYRLTRNPQPWNAGGAEHVNAVAFAVVNAVAAGADDVPDEVASTTITTYVPTNGEWDDPSQRLAWETVLVDPSNWQPSQCARSATSTLWPPELVPQHLGSDWYLTGHRQLSEEPAINARPASEMRRTRRLLELRERRLSRLALKEITHCFRIDIVAQAEAFGIAHIVNSAVVYNWLCNAPRSDPPIDARGRNDSSSAMVGEPLTRRLQSIQAAPLLLPLWLQSTNEIELCTSTALNRRHIGQLQRGELDRVVDTGQPLYAYLSTSCRLSERTIRHLRRSPIRMHTLQTLFTPGNHVSWRDVADDALGFVRWLDALPVEHWPRTPRGWCGWAEFMHATHALFEATRVLQIKHRQHGPHHVTNPEVEVGAVASATMGIDAPSHWDLTDVKSSRIYRFAAASLAREVARRWRTRPNHYAGGNRHDEHTDLRMNVRDLVGSIEMVALRGVSDDDAALETLHRAAARRMHSDPAFGIAITSLRSWTMQQWYEAGRQWHALWTPAQVPTLPDGSGEVALADDRLEQDAALAWLALVTADALPDIAANLAIKHERAVVWLVSSAALSREGAELSTCVASYEYRCLNQRDHIASVRDLNGTRQSTLRIQIRYELSAWVPVLVEHRAHRNAVPSEACAAAAATLMTALRRSHLQALWERLESARKERHAARLRGGTAQQRQAVAIHIEVLEQVLPPGMAAALLGGSLSG